MNNPALKGEDLEAGQAGNQVLPPALRSSIKFIDEYAVKCTTHTEAVSDCLICNWKYVKGQLATLSSRCESLQGELAQVRMELGQTYENLVIVRMQDYMDLTPPQAAYKLYSLWQDAIHKPHEAHPENIEIASLQAELAREREESDRWRGLYLDLYQENQELRQVVKEYRESSKGRDHLFCRKWEGPFNPSDHRCETCIKADALLAPKPAEGDK